MTHRRSNKAYRLCFFVLFYFACVNKYLWHVDKNQLHFVLIANNNIFSLSYFRFLFYSAKKHRDTEKLFSNNANRMHLYKQTIS